MTDLLDTTADLVPTTWVLKRGGAEIEIIKGEDQFNVHDNTALFLSGAAATFEDAQAMAEEMAADYEAMVVHYKAIESIKDRWRGQHG